MAEDRDAPHEHVLVAVEGLGLRCWRCGLPDVRVRSRRPSLTRLAKRFRTDKWGSGPGRHRYTPHYERHLTRWRNQPINVLEIGIGGYDHEGEGGASLRMWKAFFPHASIVGLDIEDKSFVDEPRIRTYQGDQSDPALLNRIVAESGPFTVIIDDGSHRPEHILATFDVLFPLLDPEGVYFIEDTQTSYWPWYGGAADLADPGTSMALVKRLVDGLNYEEFAIEDYQPTYTDRRVTSVHCYHNLVAIQKGRNEEGSRRQRFAGGAPATAPAPAAPSQAG